jgi:phosphoglycerate dehydrogenase-like enzyme
VDLGVALVADPEPAEVVQVSKAALHDPALAPEPRPVGRAAAGDDGCDAERSEQPAVLVMVIATVGQQPVGLLARAATLAFHRPAVQILEQRDQLGDVVAVATGEGDRKRDAAGVDEQMVL